MKIVAGLGNPGPRYLGTRHNAGFEVLDELARRWRCEFGFDRHFEAAICEAQRGPERVWLLKPQTFMNLSGRSVAAALRFYKLAPADLLVVCDDLDLPVGKIRLRTNGSSGGQKGLADVIRSAGTDEIPRLRLGIGKVDPSAMVDYVLSRFDPQERVEMDAAVKRAADAVECWIGRGIDAAMNEFNKKGD